MNNYLSFVFLSVGMVLTPGPSMVYLISRSINQGIFAGLVSLSGMALGFIIYMLCAALGITAFLFGIPYAHDIIRVAGSAYLLWFAWQSIRPGGISLFHVHKLDLDRPRKLFIMGFVTNILNPKIAIMYMSLLPQFIDVNAGKIFLQSISLGLLQISISMIGNCIIIVFAGSISLFLNTRPRLMKIQRYVMGTALCVLALSILVK